MGDLAAGVRGLGYWSRVGGKETLWNAPNGFPLFYDRANAPPELSVQEPLLPSRRLEAWRTGIEDRWVVEAARRLASARLQRNPMDPLAIAVAEFADRAVADVLARTAAPNTAADAVQWLIGRLDALGE